MNHTYHTKMKDWREELINYKKAKGKDSLPLPVAPPHVLVLGRVDVALKPIDVVMEDLYDNYESRFNIDDDVGTPYKYFALENKAFIINQIAKAHFIGDSSDLVAKRIIRRLTSTIVKEIQSINSYVLLIDTLEHLRKIAIDKALWDGKEESEPMIQHFGYVEDAYLRSARSSIDAVWGQLKTRIFHNTACNEDTVKAVIRICLSPEAADMVDNFMDNHYYRM